MTYQVIITQRAKDDLQGYYLLAKKHAPETAFAWLQRFEVAIATLSNDPERYPLAPEDNLVGQTIRQFFFGKRRGRFRILFTVREQTVAVLHIRRGSMDRASEGEFME